MTNGYSRLPLLPVLLAAALLTTVGDARALDPTRAEIRDFVSRLHSQYDFDKAYIENAIAGAESKESILKAISRPAEKSKPWHEYRKIFINEQRIKAGASFWRKHARELAIVSDRTGVPEQIIVAIIGVETHYGRITGKYRVLDSLATLAFDYPPRAEFFTRELENFFLLSREERIDLHTVKGSYAGAMGAAQFMPSSYRLYAADGDNDGQRDLWNSWEDVFSSIANYFIAHGWRSGEQSVARASVDENTAALLASTMLTPGYRLGFLRAQGIKFDSELSDDDIGTLIPYDGAHNNEYWVGFRNFYVITRYNRSRMYALSVLQLGQEIRDRVHR